MILISGSDDTGYEATIKMGAKSEPIEVVIDQDGDAVDISGREFQIKLGSTKFPMLVESGVAKIIPSAINLDAGIYPFTVQMDGLDIMKGYFEWQDDDN